MEKEHKQLLQSSTNAVLSLSKALSKSEDKSEKQVNVANISRLKSNKHGLEQIGLLKDIKTLLQSQIKFAKARDREAEFEADRAKKDSRRWGATFKSFDKKSTGTGMGWGQASGDDKRKKGWLERIGLLLAGITAFGSGFVFGFFQKVHEYFKMKGGLYDKIKNMRIFKNQGGPNSFANKVRNFFGLQTKVMDEFDTATKAAENSRRSGALRNWIDRLRATRAERQAARQTAREAARTARQAARSNRLNALRTGIRNVVGGAGQLLRRGAQGTWSGIKAAGRGIAGAAGAVGRGVADVTGSAVRKIGDVVRNIGAFGRTLPGKILTSPIRIPWKAGVGLGKVALGPAGIAAGLGLEGTLAGVRRAREARESGLVTGRAGGILGRMGMQNTTAMGIQHGLNTALSSLTGGLFDVAQDLTATVTQALTFGHAYKDETGQSLKLKDILLGKKGEHTRFVEAQEGVMQGIQWWNRNVMGTWSLDDYKKAAQEANDRTRDTEEIQDVLVELGNTRYENAVKEREALESALGYAATTEDMQRATNNIRRLGDFVNHLGSLSPYGSGRQSFSMRPSYFASGGWVNKPTLGVVGEAGVPEIMTPTSPNLSARQLDNLSTSFALQASGRGSMVSMAQQAQPNIITDASSRSTNTVHITEPGINESTLTKVQMQLT